MKRLTLSCLLFLAASATLNATPCIVPDAAGTATLQPTTGCEFVSVDQLFITNGLPLGTTVAIDATLTPGPINLEGVGGALGGTNQIFSATLDLDMTGTGTLSGYTRSVSMSIAFPNCETHAGPRTPGNPVQSFATDVFLCQGQLAPGDPDFDLLRITAGTAFGMPSPGLTTLTQMGPNWNVDSFFDITYRIDFVGHPGSQFGGMSGSTTATSLFHLGEAVGIPEPGTMSLLLCGGLALAAATRRRK